MRRNREIEAAVMTPWPSPPPRPTYHVGVDLGKRRDHTAIAIARVVRPRDLSAQPSSTWPTDYKIPHGETMFEVGEFGRLPLGTDYWKTGRILGKVLARVSEAGPCRAYVEASGPGEQVLDMMVKTFFPPGAGLIRCWTVSSHRFTKNGAEWSVGKEALISSLDAKLGRRIKISDTPGLQEKVRSCVPN
jgi:hypothetical protein